jgi:hypothetical protein
MTMANQHAPSEATLRFMLRYGFTADLMAGPDDPYQIENASDDFAGKIRHIRIIKQAGRFGGMFTCILHATILARVIGCDRIEAYPFGLGPSKPTLQVREITYSFRPFGGSHDPTLAGGFFNTFAFESCLQAVPCNFVDETIDRFLRPLFAHHLNRARPADPSAMILNFRSGDIFDDPPASTWYVQPPASFYIKAFEFARRHLGVKRAVIVYEDNRNPAVGAVETYLNEHGLAFIDLSGDPERDLRSLLSAAHIAAPFSTFTEAAALLSRNLRNYFAFRSIEAHADLHQRRVDPMLSAVLRSRGGHPFVIHDRGGAYIAPKDWRNSDEQRRMIVNYPKEHLEVRELAQPQGGALAAANNEAFRLRRVLRERNHEADELQRKLSDREALVQPMERSTRWRLTAPIRALMRSTGRG